MARQSSTAHQRQLTLTEELEKLEQSITLTLQEIDHNFSRAHRIVTSSILPIVEQYANHSKEVWEGSKFWKQFFESSANVSLSNYEEEPFNQNGAGEDTVTEDSHTTTHTTLETSQSYETPYAQHISTDSIQDLDLSNMTISPSKSSTPRPSTKQVRNQDQTAKFAEYPSPYEALQEEVNQTAMDTTSQEQTQTQLTNLPSTPGRQQPTLNPSAIAMTPQSSPFLPPHPTSIPRPSTTRKRTDPLLHRVLDRNYRIQATPLTINKYSTLPKPLAVGATPGTSQRTRQLFDSTTLSSSPEVAPPQLHEEIFSSPQRKHRTPGVSVLTPARSKGNRQKQPQLHTPSAKFPPPGTRGYDSDDDDLEDSDLQFGSPPKTMQFHVPQSRLLKTPAKEASQRIVNNILATAGLHDRDYDPNANHEDDDDDILDFDDDELDLDLDDEDDNAGGGAGGVRGAGGRDGGISARDKLDLDDGSPSVVRRVGVEDETF